MSTLNVTNIKAADGTSGLSIANSTGIVTASKELVETDYMIDQWRLNAATNSGTNGVVGQNWERVDSTGWSGIGTQMQEASGLFTFPRTGLYQVTFFANISCATNQATLAVYLQVSPNSGTDYTNHARAEGGTGTGNGIATNLFMQSLVNVIDVSTYRVRFETASFVSGTYIYGNTGTTDAGVMFERKGPSQ